MAENSWGDTGIIEGSKSNANIDAMSISGQTRERYKQDTRFRKHFSWWVMSIAPAWLVIVATLVYLCASGLFYLSDAAIVALLTTTTANVLGLAYIVLHGIFDNTSVSAYK